MRTRLALFLLFLLLCSSLPSSAEEELFDTQTALTYRDQGLAALRHKNYDAAINAFEEAVSVSPDAESYYLLGYAYYLKGKTGDGESRQKAIENFNQAYQINSNFTPSKFKPEELVMTPAGKAEGIGAAAPAAKQETQAAPVPPKSEPSTTTAPQPATGPTSTPKP